MGWYEFGTNDKIIKMMKAAYPVVLSLSGHDPTGGAGIQADIETMAAVGCRAATIVTCLTVQDTMDVQRLIPSDAEIVSQQARTLLADIPIKVIKIGLLGSVEIVDAVADLLREYPHTPVIFDPVLAAGGGTEVSDEALISQLTKRLLPRATLATPNSLEARRLAGEQTLPECADAIISLGCRAVLITGTHDEGPEVTNHLFQSGEAPISNRWPRLDGSFHGSGCTIASAAAAFMALGRSLEESVLHAQSYTWQSLAAGYKPGKGQFLPDRFSTRRTHRQR